MIQLQRNLRFKNTTIAITTDLPPSGSHRRGAGPVMTLLASSSSFLSALYYTSEVFEGDTGHGSIAMDRTNASFTTRPTLSPSYPTATDTTMGTALYNYPVADEGRVLSCRIFMDIKLLLTM